MRIKLAQVQFSSIVVVKNCTGVQGFSKSQFDITLVDYLYVELVSLKNRANQAIIPFAQCRYAIPDIEESLPIVEVPASNEA